MAFFLINLFIGVALMVVSYLIMPKPKTPKQEITEGDEPVASAGIPVAVLFGTKTIKAPNCLWFGDKYYRKSEVKA